MAVGLPGDFLFLDESGDLGSAPCSTEIFAIGILHLRSRDALKRAIKRARRKSLGRRSPLNELKWSQSSEKVRRAVIPQIAREASQIAGISACVINKRWINDRLARRREEVRYNYAVRLALEKGSLFGEAARGQDNSPADRRKEPPCYGDPDGVRPTSACERRTVVQHDGCCGRFDQKPATAGRGFHDRSDLRSVRSR